MADVYPTGETGWDMDKIWPVANSFISDNTRLGQRLSETATPDQ